MVGLMIFLCLYCALFRGSDNDFFVFVSVTWIDPMKDVRGGVWSTRCG